MYSVEKIVYSFELSNTLQLLGENQNASVATWSQSWQPTFLGIVGQCLAIAMGVILSHPSRAEMNVQKK